jgi:O-antigen ligase
LVYDLRLINLLLLGTAGVSLAVHYISPALELALVPRSAGIYTYMYGGAVRAQGILSGPFHLSMLGTYLLLAGLYESLFLRRIVVPAAFALVGAACVLETEVRTGMVIALAGTALYLVGILVILLRRSFAYVFVLLAVALLVLSFGTWVAFGDAESLPKSVTSLATLGQDQRAVGRVETWRESVSLAIESPGLGWGTGSAGDTLGSLFTGNVRHVTAHNVFLKYLVEGGVLAGALFVGLVVMLGYQLLRGPRPSRAYGLMAFGVLIGFGVTGASVEAIPVSPILAVISAATAASTPLWGRNLMAKK